MEQELRSSGLRAHSSLCFSGALIDGPRIQQLLLQCAAALESNDVTLAQQAMWVLNNIASSQGDPNQRLTSWLLHALVACTCRLCGPRATGQDAVRLPANGAPRERAMSVTELADYIDLTPWHRFGFTASNGATAPSSAPSLAPRIVGCFNFHWIRFDALDTFAPKDSPHRLEYEAAVGRKIESVIEVDGTERAESGTRLTEKKIITM